MISILNSLQFFHRLVASGCNLTTMALFGIKALLNIAVGMGQPARGSRVTGL